MYLYTSQKHTSALRGFQVITQSWIKHINCLGMKSDTYWKVISEIGMKSVSGKLRMISWTGGLMTTFQRNSICKRLRSQPKSSRVRNSAEMDFSSFPQVLSNKLYIP